MAGWSGFTENELLKLKEETEGKETGKTKSSTIGQKQRRKVREKMIQTVSKSQSKTSATIDPIPVKAAVKEETIESSQATLVVKETVMQPIPASTEDKGDSKNTFNEENIGVLSDEKAVELEMCSLEKLHLQQKHIEAQNKKKQAFIKQALSDRFKQTEVEASKLKAIQKELSRLDEVLQVDVEILRNKIDESCLSFSHAQKRYEKAEVEFVDAKMDYYLKKEEKEELAEHLYKIIQANELRKAKKLEQLMLKLSSGLDSIPSSPTSSPPSPTKISSPHEDNLEFKIVVDKATNNNISTDTNGSLTK